MGWRRHLFNAMYKLGRPLWDTPVPEEIRDIAEGRSALAPGRALDLGCGTSGNVAYLARHDWDALGVDFSEAAIKKATENAAGVPGAEFVVADVTKLAERGIAGPFDLVIDNGCYHTLADGDKDAYLREVAAVMKPGAPLLMWEGIRVGANEISERFERDFTVERIEQKEFVIGRFRGKLKIKDAKWYWLQRR